MKKYYLIVIFLISCISFANAQIYIDNQGNVYDNRETAKPVKNRTEAKAPKKISTSKFDPRRLEFGGNFGLQFGNYTVVNIAPQVGYRFSNLFSAGAGIGYTYYKDDRYGEQYKEHYASLNLYGTLYPVSFLVLSVSPEISRMWQTYEYMGVKDNYSKFVPSVVVGAGFRLGAITAQIKYDVVQDEYSPYGNRLFYSIGYTFGF